MKDTPKVSVVIPTYNRDQQLEALLRSLFGSDYPVWEIVVVDNAGRASTEALCGRFHKIRYLAPERNLFCNGARSFAIPYLTGELIFFVDDDNIVDPQAIGSLVESFHRLPEHGALGLLTFEIQENLVIWFSSGWFTKILTAYHVTRSLPNGIDPRSGYHLISGADWLPNAFMVRRWLLEEARVLRPEIFPHNGSEFDMVQQIRAVGLSSGVDLGAVTYHDVGYSGYMTRLTARNVQDAARSRVLLHRIHFNSPLRWLTYWTVLLPSTLGYMCWKTLPRADRCYGMVRASLRGTVEGFRFALD
jgi:GT2 family glycosyltransferase